MNIIFQNVSNKPPITALYCKLSNTNCQARVMQQPSVQCPPLILDARIATFHPSVHVRVSVCLSEVLLLIVLIVLIYIVDCVNRVNRIIRATMGLVAFFCLLVNETNKSTQKLLTIIFHTDFSHPINNGQIRIPGPVLSSDRRRPGHAIQLRIQ